MTRIFILLMCFISKTFSFYVPVLAPVEFKLNQQVDVKAIKLTSTITQLPYDYYIVPFCKPAVTDYKAESLGEVLRGDRIVNTEYRVNMTQNAQCKVMCPVELNAMKAASLYSMIQHEYTVQLLIDNLPCVTRYRLLDNGAQHYYRGYRLGFVDNDKVYVNNHLKLILKYHTEETPPGVDQTYRVVGFEVEPQSVDFSEFRPMPDGTCQVVEDSASSGRARTLKWQQIPPPTASAFSAKGADDERAVMRLRWTYEVQWEPSELRWTSRWDALLALSDPQIHWFSIVNSLVVVMFLAGVLAMIIVRTLRRDIAKYNQDDDEMDDTLEETGWKLVHGDVFRPPPHSRWFAALTGAGIQLILMAATTIGLAMLGMLSPSSRGALLSAALVLFMLFGLIAGYYSGRLYRTCRGQQWKSAAMLTGSLYPGVVGAVCFILNLFMWAEGSSSAIPFGTIVALIAMWVGVQLPLTFIGYYFGFRKQPYEHPVRTNQIPRQVPEQQFYLQPFVSLLMAGVLPFGAMFIELFFIFSAIWENQFYYMFGFLALVYVILAISCSQIAIVLVYFQLCSENYHWWWRSFYTSGGCAIYVFAYSIFYFVTKLEIHEFIPACLYFGYSLIMALTVWLLCGTIGFYAAYAFVRRIYASIKID